MTEGRTPYLMSAPLLHPLNLGFLSFCSSFSVRSHPKLLFGCLSSTLRQDGGHIMTFPPFMAIAANQTEEFLVTRDICYLSSTTVLYHGQKWSVKNSPYFSEVIFHTLSDHKWADRLYLHDFSQKPDSAASLPTLLSCWDIHPLPHPV